jgi:3-hydroxybutyryl-CoA dehydrogenase
MRKPGPPCIAVSGAADHGRPEEALASTKRLGIAGSGAIACGLAVTGATHGQQVMLLARSEKSAERARETVDKTIAKMRERGAEIDPELVQITANPRDLAGCSYVVEAVVEDPGVKAKVLSELNQIVGPDTILATTTSSLKVADLAEASGRPDRFVGLHVFNPVAKMKLVELIFPEAVGEDTRQRTRELCEDLEKTAVVVPDVPGFVVNRLLFPYLFSAVELVEETGMDPADVDKCMKLGASHPMGPNELLDFIGLDVAVAIAEQIGVPVPPLVKNLVAKGELGRKTGSGIINVNLQDLEKTAVVPDVPDVVVNRLLLPYLFSAVELVEETGMDPADVDTCMKLGAGDPKGPNELLDFIGPDVAVATAEQIGVKVPPLVKELAAKGELGRKTGSGIFTVNL